MTDQRRLEQKPVVHTGATGERRVIVFDMIDSVKRFAYREVVRLAAACLTAAAQVQDHRSNMLGPEPVGARPAICDSRFLRGELDG